MHRLSEIEAIVDLAEIRASSNGLKKPSPEMTLLLALVMFDGYEFFPMPDPKVETALELAKRVGTLDKLDRSKQYEGRYSGEALLGSINALGYNQRKRDKAQFRRHLIVMVLGAVLARAPEIFDYLRWLFG